MFILCISSKNDMTNIKIRYSYSTQSFSTLNYRHYSLGF